MKSIDELIAEHKAVMLSLAILEKVEQAIAKDDSQASSDLAELLEFFKGFVDKCHHAKEEDILFPELEQLGVARHGGPISVLLQEHQAGRQHIQDLSVHLSQLQTGDKKAAAQIAMHSRAYIETLSAHIEKENKVLFPLAEKLMTSEIDKHLVNQFFDIERDRVGAGKHEAYHAMLHRLKSKYDL